MKKSIYLFTFPIFLFIVCSGFIFTGCRETSVEVNSLSDNNYLFIEFSLLTDGQPKNNGYINRLGSGYNIDENNYSFILYSESVPGIKIKETDKFLLGKKTDLSKNIGGGTIGSITALENFSKVDSISNAPFPGSYQIEMISNDEYGNVKIKLSNKLISLKLKESFIDSVKEGNCIINDTYEYSNITNHITITNYGFISKNKVKYSSE